LVEKSLLAICAETLGEAFLMPKDESSNFYRGKLLTHGFSMTGRIRVGNLIYGPGAEFPNAWLLLGVLKFTLGGVGDAVVLIVHAVTVLFGFFQKVINIVYHQIGIELSVVVFVGHELLGIEARARLARPMVIVRVFLGSFVEINRLFLAIFLGQKIYLGMRSSGLSAGGGAS
jgi:hypothetical protein